MKKTTVGNTPKTKREQYGEGNPNHIVIGANMKAAQPIVAPVNENARLMGKYMIPPVVESQSSIVYPAFGQANPED